MLSRVAESLYWMGRYLERAEHSARVLESMRDLRLDLFEVDREVTDEQWRGALQALQLPDGPVESLVLDPAEPNSLLCSMSRARENARQVRETISPEMWQELNRQYWALRDAVGVGVNEGTVSQTLTGIVSFGFLWDGVTDATMIRGEGWLFLKLGKFVERIDGVARLIATRLESTTQPDSAESGENVKWLSLLKSLDALDAYRKAHPKRVDRRAVLVRVRCTSTCRCANRSNLPPRASTTNAHSRGSSPICAAPPCTRARRVWSGTPPPSRRSRRRSRQNRGA